MEILVDQECVCTLNETQKKVIMNDIHADEFDADMKRRVSYVVMHKHEQCMKRLRDEWTPKLRDLNVESVPLNDDAFAELVFARPEYKDRKARELEAVAAKDVEA